MKTPPGLSAPAVYFVGVFVIEEYVTQGADDEWAADSGKDENTADQHGAIQLEV